VIEYLSRFFRWSWQNKRNFGICLAATSLFIFLLFPFDELTDKVSSEVSKQTGNQVYLQMDGLNISLLTGLRLELDKVLLQAPSLPPIKINRLEVSPSLFSLLEQFPLGTVIAEGLLRGTLEARVSAGAKGGSGQKRQQLSVQADKVSLEQLSQFLKLQVLLKGQAQMDVKSLTDFTFVDQPEADINMTVQKFAIPAATIRSPAGPIDIPDLKIGTVQLKGKLSSGILQIDSAKMGSPEDDLIANISGQIKVRMQLQGGQVVPVLSGYNLSVEMSLKKSVLNSVGMFLFPLDNYKREQADGALYRFKMRADNMQAPPSFGSIQ